MEPLYRFIAKATARLESGMLDNSTPLHELVESWRECAADEREQALWRLEPEPLDLPSRVEERRQHAFERMDQLAEEAALADKGAVDQQAHADGVADNQPLPDA